MSLIFETVFLSLQVLQVNSSNDGALSKEIVRDPSSSTNLIFTSSCYNHFELPFH